MKIRNRITLLFTALVTSLLLILCLSIYYVSELNRQKDMQRRMRYRSFNTINLLSRVKGINPEVMKRIDSAFVMTFRDKSIVVYDSSNTEIYTFADPGVIPYRVAVSAISAVPANKETYFTLPDKREAMIISKVDAHRRFTAVTTGFDHDGIEKMSQLRTILLFSFFSGSLITFLSGWFFSLRLVIPIKKISNEVKEISSQNLSRRIQVNEPRDELDELSATFNDLLTRLQQSFEIQRRFIANASHELSTPLTSISSQLEITLQNDRQADEYRAVIKSVYEDVKNLNRLTRSLLEIAKASGTSYGMDLTLVRIDELLMRLPGDIRRNEANYQVDLDFDSFPDSDDNMFVFGNSDLLYSAIKNIVSNACKFSSNQTALVFLSFGHNELMVKVKNIGSVIAPAEQALIFQPFYRSQSGTEVAGFGLGLPLASRIVNMHKGNIQLVSDENQGTIFTITLPVARRFHEIA
jgi:two-component system sensor histidine kinase ArlS